MLCVANAHTQIHSFCSKMGNTMYLTHALSFILEQKWLAWCMYIQYAKHPLM